MFPGEAFATAACNLLTELIKGQSAEQKAILWQQWIDFWSPIMPKTEKKS